VLLGSDGELFPHLYGGELPVKACVGVFRSFADAKAQFGQYF
jgi:uncharacterized protein (DUF952 family)